MKTNNITKVLFLLPFYLFTLLPLSAQNSNVLSLQDVNGMRGKVISVPVYLDNTSEIAALQFDITLPSGSQVMYDSTKVADARKADHIISGQNKGSNKHRFMLYSPTNQVLRGNSGKLCDIVFKIYTGLQDDQTYDIKLSNVVMSDRNGANVFTNSTDGTLTLTTYPDFEVSNLAVTQADITPKGTLGLSWQVSNIGETAATGGWKENFYLVGDNNTELFIGSNSFESTGLAPGASVSRNIELTLPEVLSVEGAVKVKVNLKGNSDSGERSEAEWNNTATQETGVSMVKTMQLVMPETAIAENQGRNVRLRLNRSGSRTAEETFTLACDKPDRLSVPATVTISKNQSGAYFYVNVVNNDTYDNDDNVVTITATGTGYAAATGQLTIEDDEYPDMQLQASKSELNEGETFQLTVTLPKAAKTDTQVKFTAETPKRFNMPSSVTIAQGQTSASVDVEVIQNDLPELQLSTAFYATAERYNKAECIVLVNDNDMPELELVLSPTQVSESAGPSAIMAKLLRKSHADSDITIVLSDDSGKNDIYYSQKRFTMKAGVTTAEFALGVVDNVQKEGDRTVNISAGVYVSSCNCAATGTTLGASTVPVTILDDDGPTLSMTSSSSSLLEGKENATVLTIKRNTGTAGTTTVTISSDRDGDLTYNPVATIADGQESTTVAVSVKKNDTPDDERTVVFTAAADGYTQGTCWALITDQTMPDATVSAPVLAQAEVPAAGTADVTVTVSNIGNTSLPAQTKVALYMDNNLLTTLYTQEAVAAGSNTDIAKQITLPNLAGSYSLKAVVNEDKSVKELVYINNTSATTPLTLTAPFTATVTVDKNIYQSDEPVAIKGTATGSSVANKTVEIYLIHNNVRDTLNATTDANGRFSATFNPKGVAGHYGVGACYTGENLRDVQAAFDIYGMRRTDNSYLKYEPSVDVPYSAQVSITNSGELPLHNITMEVVSSGGNIEVAAQPIATLDGGKSANLPFTLTGTSASTGDDWQQLKVRFTSDEGAAFDGLIYYYNRTATGKLRASVTSINTTMVKGEQRDYSFDITNTGFGTTGKISLSLPEGSWMTAVTGKEMGALASTDTTTIVLRFTPTSDMQLNVPIRGNIGINCENGQGLSLPFSVEPVSDNMGVFVVDVCDEYTYYTDEAPHLKGAAVKVTHPTTGQLVAEGTTDESGLFMANLPEGWYTLSVSADKHDSYRGNVLVDPGRQTTKVVNLSYQAVTINWEVKETEVEDKYEIVTTTTFETHVPAPVVVIRGPEKIDGDAMTDGESQLLYYTVTNEGLINAKNCVFNGPASDSEFTFETLANTGPFDLAANQSVLIPVKVTRHIASTGARGEGNMLTEASSGGSNENAFTHCMKNLGVLYEVLCGKDLKSNSAMLTLAVRACVAGVAGGVFLGGGGGGPGSPGKGSGGSYYGGGGSYTYLTSDDPCDPDLANTKKTIMDGLTSMAPGMGGCLAYGINAESLAQSMAAGDDAATAGNVCNFGATTATTFSHPIAQPFLGFLSLCAGMYGNSNARALFNTVTEESTQEKLMKRYSWLADFTEAAQWYYRQMLCYREVFMSFYGDEIWFSVDDETRPAFFQKICSFDNHEDITYENLKDYKPASVTEDQAKAFIERLQNTIFKRDSENKMDLQYMLYNIAQAKYINRYEIPTWRPGQKKAVKQALGFNNTTTDTDEPYYGDDIYPAGEYFVAACDQVKDDFNDASKTQSVCATIKLQFKQQLVLTRQAFRGTLTVSNGNEEAAMTDVKLKLTVTDEEGNVATAHEFQINNESLEGFTGELDGEWELAAGGKGTATILFIPTKYAAPTSDCLYSFGGSLSYLDPNSGLTVTRDLDPVTLTVKPSPNLDLTYFMQRDIYGDDPLTKNVVEPIVPAEFALLINNVGYGDATNVRMTTEQPKIIENEKGLLIDFELLSSQVNGGDKTLALGSSVPADFGTIPAQSTSYAQWWFTSTLLGHFLDYDVQATHLTSYGNEDLSLLNDVTIHELIRSINAKAANGQPLKGWLVNDIQDREDLPDMLYLSDGTTEEVSVATATVSMANATTALVTVQPGTKAWNYGNVNDPTAGRQNIVSITRDDGVEIDLRNFWQTDRTLRDGMDPVTEYRIHFADKLPVTGEAHTYTITFEPRPNVVLAVSGVEGLPKNNELTRTAITTMTVKLNKAVQAFTAEHVRLECQGKKLLQEPTITKVDDLTYQLSYSTLEGASGYLVLTVYTSKMTDTEGYNGENDYKTTWIQFIDGKCTLNMAASPVYGGTVTPGSSTQDYDTDVTVTATPAKGYAFSHWAIDGETISEEAEMDYHITDITTLTAVFTPLIYNVNVTCDERQGIVRGIGSGRYEYGTTAHLTVTPSRFYTFNGWKVNGTEAGNDGNLDITIEGETQIEALFTYTPPRLTTSYYLAEGWNWIAVNPTDASLLDPTVLLAPLGDKVLEIRSKDKSLVCEGGEWKGDLTALSPGEFYQVHVSEAATINIDSRIPEANTIALTRGWNYLSFDAVEELPLATALTNWQAWENDMVKGQDGFAVYDGSQWVGTLQTMQPGKGYQIYSQTVASFTYPTTPVEEDITTVADFDDESATSARGQAPAGSLSDYNVPRRLYADNMCIVADIDDNGVVSNIDRYAIGAFIGDDCRGISQLIDGKYYITVYGADQESVDFYVYDSGRTMFVDSEGNALFSALQNCHLDQPTQVHITATPTSINSIGNSQFTIDHSQLTIDNARGNIYTLDGRKVANSTSTGRLPRGVYIVNGKKVVVK